MKNAIVTVDTEGHAGTDPIRHLIMGETGDGKYGGIPLIMDICDEYGIKALFFLDFAEAWDYGERKVAAVAEYIKQRGHDIGVHIHPDHMADPSRQFLYDYSVEEQSEIITKCSLLYEKILGDKPKAFRAGKYAANIDTLNTIAKLGYKADFSQFFGSKWCGINPPVTGNESVMLKSGIIEFPVISYRTFFPCVFDRYDKLDVNASRLEQEFVFKRVEKQNRISTISIFVHSFSLLKWRQNVNNPQIDNTAVKKFRKALMDVIESNEVEFVDLDNLLQKQYPFQQEQIDEVLSFGGIPAVSFFVEKAIKVLGFRYYSKKYGKTL